LRSNIVLVNPPSRSINHYRPPLSLMYVAEYFRSHDWRVRILDLPIKQVVRDKKFWKDRDRTVEQLTYATLKKLKYMYPEYVGISCYSPELDEVKDLIRKVRATMKTKIIVGGIHPTLHPEDFEGMVEGVHRGRADVGRASYDLVDMGYYTNANPYAIRGVFLRCAYILSSIGCPSQCTFCAAKSLRNHFRADKLKTPPQLKEEVVWLRERYKIDAFYFIDDLFTTDKAYLMAFCMEMIRNRVRLLWGCSSKVTTLNKDLIKLMANAGCIQMDFGVERGDDEELKALKKGQTTAQVEEVFQYCKEEGIRTFANYLVNLPGRDARGLQKIRENIKRIKPDVVSVNVYRGYVGTELPDRQPTKRILAWTDKVTKEQNSLHQNLKFHLTWRYISTVIRSKRKWNYISQLGLLVKEIINQKVGG